MKRNADLGLFTEPSKIYRDAFQLLHGELNLFKQLSTKLIRKILNSLDFDIIRLNASAMRHLLGIRSLPIKTIFDIGANEGQFAKLISGYFPQAQLICFEPLKKEFNQLKSWSETFDKNKPIIYNEAIGEKIGYEKIFLHEEHSPSSSLLPSTKILEEAHPKTVNQTHIPIKINTLDNIMNNSTSSLEEDILIKIDVQGYEDRVIRGGKKILEKTKVLLIEINLESFYHNQTSFYELLCLLKDNQFRYAGNLDQNYNRDGFVSYFDAVFFNNTKDK